jgi:hypothetical protein
MRPKRKASTLPRPLSPELSLVPSYRAGLYAELQKFGSSKRDRQTTLWEAEVESSDAVAVSGLNLSVPEDKALSAVQMLLDKTGYQGTDGRETRSEPFKWSGRLPRLSITHSQYFEAYGLERARDGQYSRHQEAEALEALWSLTTPRAVYYERKHWDKGRQLSDIIRAKAPLLTLIEIMAYKDLPAYQADQLKAGQQVASKPRATGLLIECSPLLVDSIDSFYTLKPTTLHKEIQQHHGSKKVSRAVSLFIEWLLTLDRPTIGPQKATLIEKLRLSKYVEDRHKERAEARLQEALSTAKALGYLLDYQDTGTGKVSLKLNPERCYRVRQKAGRKDEKANS